MTAATMKRRAVIGAVLAAVAAVWLFSHFANAPRSITIAVLRITECPRPQSSVQITS